MIIYISFTCLHLLHLHKEDFQASVYQELTLEAIITQAIKVISQILPYLVHQAAHSQVELKEVAILLLEVHRLKQGVEVELVLLLVVFLKVIPLLVANISEELDRVLFEV